MFGEEAPLMCLECIRSYKSNVTSQNEHVTFPFAGCRILPGFNTHYANCLYSDSACEAANRYAFASDDDRRLVLAYGGNLKGYMDGTEVAPVRLPDFLDQVPRVVLASEFISRDFDGEPPEDALRRVKGAQSGKQ